MITEQGKQYCPTCGSNTNHIPKMDAVKNGQRVCEECRCCNRYYDRDELLEIYQIAWNEELDNTWRKKDFGTNEKNAAHNLGRIHAVVGDDVSSIDEMSEDQIIAEIIEDSTLAGATDMVQEHGLVSKVEEFLNECEIQLSYEEYMDVVNELKEVTEKRLTDLNKKKDE